MAISVTCPNANCRQILSAKDSLAGKRVKCPKCGTVLNIPSMTVPEASSEPPVSSSDPASPSQRPAIPKSVDAPAQLVSAPKRNRRTLVIAAALAAVVLAGIAAIFVFGRGGDPPKTQDDTAALPSTRPVPASPSPDNVDDATTLVVGKIQEITLPGIVTSMVVKGDTAFVACGDNNIHLLALNRGEIIGVMKGHSKTVMTLAMSADGARLLSGSSDNTIRFWMSLV